MFKIKCYVCDGEGQIYESVDETMGHYIVCWRCMGKRKLGIFNILAAWFWTSIAPVWVQELDTKVRVYFDGFKKEAP